MTPQEHREKYVSELIESIEEQYQSLLAQHNAVGNALMKHIFLEEVIGVMSSAPAGIDPILRDQLLLRLYLMRSELSTDAEFIKVMNEL